MYVSSRQSFWEQYLHLMEFACNKNAHVLIGMSLFQAMYGQYCLTSAFWNVSIIQVETLDQMLSTMQLEQESIKD
jgi:hypothetical protein